MPHPNNTRNSTGKNSTLSPVTNSLKFWKSLTSSCTLSAQTQNHFSEAINCFKNYEATPLNLSFPLDMKKFWLEMGYSHLYLAANIPYRQDHLLLDAKEAPKIIAGILSYGHGQALCEIAVLHYDFAYDENVASSKENKEKHLQIALTLLDIIEKKYSNESKMLPEAIQNILAERASLELKTLSSR
jgi:hypothetical protein